MPLVFSGQHARFHEVASLLVATQPDVLARTAYIDTLCVVTNWSALASPRSLVEALIQRLRDMAGQVEQAIPTVRRYPYDSSAEMRVFRQPQPWTAATEGMIGLRLTREVGDRYRELMLGCQQLALAWLDLGDQVGVAQRLQALESLVFQREEPLIDVMWRQHYARVLCEGNDESSWHLADQIIAPLLKSPPPIPEAAHKILARTALLRGQTQSAEQHARLAMQLLRWTPYVFFDLYAVLIKALIAQRRPAEAISVAEEPLWLLATDGGAGLSEVEVRLAISEAFYAAGNFERAQTEMRETLRQIKLRTDDITDPFWKNSYLRRNPYVVRAQALAQEWGLGVIVR
jgi:hypothetical protein